MADKASFADLLGRLRAGQGDAAATIVRQYGRRLEALARIQLGHGILRKEDPQDVLQSVFKSFFRRVAGGQFCLENRQDLWTLLLTLTLHKCRHRVEYYTAQRRDIRRELPDLDGADVIWNMLAREPTPMDAAILTETVQRLLDSLTEQQRPIVALSLEGGTVVQIARRLNVTQRTVQRVLKGVRERLQGWQRQELEIPGTT
jgi:RNA polymerase sigma-70 factor (ECF subfamily)